MTHQSKDQELDEFLLWLRESLPELEEEEPPPPSQELLDLAWQTVQKLQVAYGIQPAPPPPTFWQRLRNWLLLENHWGWQQGLATATLALLMVVAVTPFLFPPGFEAGIDMGYNRLSLAPSAKEWPWRPIPNTGLPTMGTDEPQKIAPTPEQLAFRHGVRQGLDRFRQQESAWASALEALPEQLPACAPGDQGCAPRQRVYQAMGRWAVLVYWQCRGPGGEVEFWTSQDKIREQLLKALRELNEQTSLAQELGAWSGGSPRERLCDGVKDLLHLGLNDPEP